MTNWPRLLDVMVREIAGPEDDEDPSVNGDIDSIWGEEDEAGFDDMPIAAGWEDEGDEEDDSEDEADE